MASEVVAGCVIPLRVADHPALELCNTGVGWTLSSGRPVPAKDYLIDARTLLVWAGAVGVLSSVEVSQGERAAAADPAAAVRALAEAARLRSAFYWLFTTPLKVGQSDRQVAGLRTAVATAVRASSLKVADDGRAAWDGGADPLRRAIHRLALSGESLLADIGAAGIGRCGGQGCGWLFLNRSGRRVWCLMPICGNRAKARRYAERSRRAERSPTDSARPPRASSGRRSAGTG